jgi:O-antigen ligase
LAVATLTSVQLWLTIAALALAPLFFGSVQPLWVVIWTILLSASVLCGSVVPLQEGQRRIVAVFVAICFSCALVAVVQVTPHLLDLLDDPIWQRTNNLLGLNVSPRISGRAEIPPAAIGHFLLLVTSFLSGLFVGTSRRNSDLLFEFARYSILLYAMYGLAALVLTPNMVLWAPKLAYRGYLTATFINHNTAATLIGAGTILWFCSAYLLLQSFRYSSLRLLLLISSNEQLASKLFFRAAAGLICFLALLLTGSRGGLICTCLGLLAAIGLMVAGRLKTRFWYGFAGGSVALSVIALWLGQTGRIGSEGAFDSGRWFVYLACIDAIRQRPLLGAGAGTFADLFPSLRPEDISSWGVWDYAHSTILEITVEMGIPIAAAVVIAAVASLFILGRAALESKERTQSQLSAVTGIAVLSCSHAMIDFSLQIPGYLIVFGILVGCGLAKASVGGETSRTATRISLDQIETPGSGARSETLKEESSESLNVG